jgi:hypothetical protein
MWRLYTNRWIEKKYSSTFKVFTSFSSSISKIFVFWSRMSINHWKKSFCMKKEFKRLSMWNRRWLNFMWRLERMSIKSRKKSNVIMKKCRISKKLEFTKTFRSSISSFEYCVSLMSEDWKWTLLTWIWSFNEKSRLIFEHSCNESIERRKIQIELMNLYDFTRSDAKKKDRFALISSLNQVNFELSRTRTNWRIISIRKRKWMTKKEKLKLKKSKK